MASQRPLLDGWPRLGDAALHGLAGEVVNTLAPHTEADAAALLFDFLVSFGNAVGPGPYFAVGAMKHFARDNVCVVGDTAKARKGTAHAEVRAVMEVADAVWSTTRVKGGLASGEGLIYAVRDDSDDHAGVSDKRLLDVEPEFARVLTVAGRKDSIVSHVIRDAWDTGRLENMTKHAPLVATNAHISILGQITVEELRGRLTDTEAMNGFGNRFMYVLVRRSKVLPSGGQLTAADYERLGRQVRERLDVARGLGRLCRTPEAEKLWAMLYRVVADQDEPGLLGSLTARADSHLLRLSLIYALIDNALSIDVAHLEAAWAVVCYADESARYIFGTAIGNVVADRILAALREMPDGAGLDGTQLRDLFARHKDGKEIDAARQHLEHLGLVENVTTKDTGGRPRTVTFLCDQSALGDQSRDRSLRSLRSQHEARLR